MLGQKTLQVEGGDMAAELITVVTCGSAERSGAFDAPTVPEKLVAPLAREASPVDFKPRRWLFSVLSFMAAVVGSMVLLQPVDASAGVPRQLVTTEGPAVAAPIAPVSDESSRAKSRATDSLASPLRTAPARVSKELVANIRDELLTGQPDALVQLSLFGESTVTVRITHQEQTSGGGMAVAGQVVGDAAGSLSLVVNGDVVSGGLVAFGKTYKLSGESVTAISLSELGPAPDLPIGHAQPGYPRASVGIVENTVKEGMKSRLNADEPMKTLVDDGSIIDVMILYTTAARVQAGSAAQIEADIDAQIVFTNLIYQNSGAVQRLRLVHKSEIAIQEQAPFTDLYRLHQRDNPAGARLAMLRNIHRADLVSVWGRWTSVCGIAPVMEQENASHSEFAVNVVACYGVGSTVMAHEFGHSMGLLHDVETFSGNSAVTPEAGGPLQAITYAHGYVDKVNRFRTIMSYDRCSQLGFGCNVIPYFSNPLKTFDNRSYFAGAQIAPLGDAVIGNEVQALNDTRETVANFRPSDTPPAAGLISFLETQAQIDEADATFTVQVHRLRGSTGAVSVSYATVAGSALAGTDFTATSGTLSWADGDTAPKTITVPILRDVVQEGSKQFTLVLSNPVGGAGLGGYQSEGVSLQVTIIDEWPDYWPPADAMPAGFTTPSDGTGWTVDTTRGYASKSSLVSAAVKPGVSILEYTGEFTAGSLSFRFLMSSLLLTSRLELSIDGVVVQSFAGGETGWQQVFQQISAGTHTIRWSFINSTAGDCICAGRAWLDDVTLPLADSNTGLSQFAFVPNSADNTVSVVSLDTRSVIATLPTGLSPRGVAATPDGKRVYVTNYGSNSVTVFDVPSMRQLTGIAVGNRPSAVAVNAAGTRAYVSHFGSGFVSVIDTATNSVLSNIPMRTGGSGIAVNGDGTLAYVTAANPSQIQVLDLVAGQAMTAVAGRFNPYGIAVTPNGDRVFAVENQDASVSIFNTPATFTGRWQAVGGQPIGIAMSARLQRAYVTTGVTNGNRIGNTVAVIDLNFQRGVTQISVGRGPFGVSVDATGSVVVAVNEGSNSVSIIDAVTETVTTTVPVGGSPTGLGNFIASLRVPTLPRNLVAQPGNGQLSLMFDAPQFDGGSPVNNYVANCQPGNISASAAASPIVVNGLANGTAYSCTVTAFNSRGEGGRTAAVTATPLAGVQITSASNTRFTVLAANSFTFTAQGSAPIQFSATGNLPSGINLTSAGVLSGTPASGTAGSYALNVTASNGTPPDAQQSFTLVIDRAAQQITFATPASRPFGSAPFTVSASGGASGNVVVFTSQTPAVCTATGSNGTLITLVAGGTCVLAANQAGNADYAPAPEVTRSFGVVTSQTITLGTLPALQAGVTVTLTATGGPSGNPVVFTSATPAICTVSGANGSQLTGVAVGTCTIKANQAGSLALDPAPEVTANIPVAQGSQVITYSSSPLPIKNDTNPITGSGKSGNPVTMVSLTPAVCSIVNGKVRMAEFALCTVVASQAGNANYLPAADVTMNFQGYAVMPQTRFGHSSHAVSDGRVLLFGGMQANGADITGIYHFIPQQKAWSLSFAPGYLPRVGHASVQTESHIAMVGGGLPAGGFASAFTAYVLAAGNTFGTAETGLDSLRRKGHALTAFQNNMIHVTGGSAADASSANFSTLYSIQGNYFLSTAPMTVERSNHAAVKLPDGSTMVMGGLGANGVVHSSTETMSFITKAWIAAASMNAARQGHRAVRLNTGKVLVVGGIDASNQPVSSAEIYDPQSNTWSSAGTVQGGTGLTLTLLGDGRVLIAGGTSRERKVDLYNPQTNVWAAQPDLLFPHVEHAAALLPDGRVLITGGHDGNPANAHAWAEVIGPNLTLKGQGLAEGRLGENYAPVHLSVFGGTAPFTFSVTSGTFPPGLSLSTDGVVSGVPTTEGTFNFNVTVDDAGGLGSTAPFELRVTQPMVTVTASASGQGTMSPTGAVSTPRGTVLSFEVTVYSGFAVNMGGTCGGTLNGSTYTTQALTTDCTVTATFVQSIFPPSAPLNVSAVGGVNSAIVSFSPPANDGGAPIGNYLVECIGDGRFYVTASGTSSPITVQGIFTGYRWVCTVQAGNMMGLGAVSALSNSFHAQLPPAMLTARVLGTAAANGQVAGAEGGINCPGDCTESINVGRAVSLTASTINGALFSGWFGSGLMCREGNDSTTCTFNMPSSAYTVTGSFATTASAPGATPWLSVSAGAGSILVMFQRPASGGSPITGFTATCTSETGVAVSVTGTLSPILVTGLTPGVAHTCRVSATNAIGTGGLSGTSQSVTPLAYPAAKYTLTVTAAGAGRGSVVSLPAGIACGSQCAADFDGGTSVTLTASPVTGSTFVGWSGGTGNATCTGTGPCTITMQAASGITATFEPPRFTVTPSAGANGGISPATPQSVTQNSTTSFTVTPAAGYAATVAGSCGGNLVGNTYTTNLIVADCTVIVSFTLAPVLQVVKSGTGQGTVTSNPAGITCGADCSESLAMGTVVTLTATPDQGAGFSGWSGVTCSGGNSLPTCNFTLNADSTVTATFDSSLVAPNDFNDDAKSDLLWRNGADGSVQGWLMNGLSATQVAGLLPAGGYTVTHVADLDGNGKADTLIRHTDGTTIGWLHDGLNVVGQATFFAPGSGWSIKHTMDLNGDGKADLIVEHTDGRVVGWLMNGLTVTGTATFVPAGTGWSVAKVGDLNGDGKADLIWQNSNGTVQAWLMDGLSATQTATFVGAGTGWSVKLVADFNGDGKSDLMWQNADGTVQAWLMDGTTISQIASFVPAGTGWSPVLAGDIDGDGKADLFWEHTDGRSQTWLMNGLSVTNLAGFVGAGGWRATHLLDLNGDGKKDVLWKHDTGTVQAWLMNGLTITQVASLAGAGAFEVIPPRP